MAIDVSLGFSFLDGASHRYDPRVSVAARTSNIQSCRVLAAVPKPLSASIQTSRRDVPRVLRSYLCVGGGGEFSSLNSRNFAARLALRATCRFYLVPSFTVTVMNEM